MPAYQNQASTEVWRLLGSFGDSTLLLMPLPMSHGLNFHGLMALVECGSPSPWSIFFTNVFIMLYSVLFYIIFWSACEGPGKNPVGDLIIITLNWQMNSPILSLSSSNGNSFWYLQHGCLVNVFKVHLLSQHLVIRGQYIRITDNSDPSVCSYYLTTVSKFLLRWLILMPT